MKQIYSKDLKVSRLVALVGIMAATVECGKIALSFLPNIEVVTILLALFGYVFGWAGVVASVVFVCIEPLVWGFGSWVITYIIYWPLVAFVFMLLRRAGVKNRWLITAVSVGLTFVFGVLSSVIDCAMFLGINENYFSNLLIYYLRGVAFYMVQIACNAVLFSTLFLLLSSKLERLLVNKSH